MKAAIPLNILPQPDDTTCGPTSLHTVYSYYGDEITLGQVIDEVEYLQDGGTLGCMLANHALERGYKATIYTYNLNIFDPTWFGHEQFFIKKKLELQSHHKQNPKLLEATKAYSKFLEGGGIIRHEVLKPSLIRRYLNKRVPILTGLSSTYLYGSMREYGENLDYDDLRGEPSGHFVVLNGYDKKRRTISVADPLHSNPLGEGPIYETEIDRLINAILLGIVTYDANLIVITPASEQRSS